MEIISLPLLSRFRKKTNSWMIIGKTLGIPDAECQKLWKGICDRFARELRVKLKPSGTGGAGRNGNTWHYMSMLSFLRSSIKHRRQTSNLQTVDGLNYQDIENDSTTVDSFQVLESDFSQEMSEINVNTEEAVGDSINTSVCSPATSDRSQNCSPTFGRKRKQSNSDRDILHALNSATNCLNNVSKKPRQETIDSEVNFCLSLVGPLKNLSKQKQALAKIKIQQVLYDVRVWRNIIKLFKFL